MINSVKYVHLFLPQHKKLHGKRKLNVFMRSFKNYFIFHI